MDLEVLRFALSIVLDVSWRDDWQIVLPKFASLLHDLKLKEGICISFFTVSNLLMCRQIAFTVCLFMHIRVWCMLRMREMVKIYWAFIYGVGSIRLCIISCVRCELRRSLTNRASEFAFVTGFELNRGEMILLFSVSNLLVWRRIAFTVCLFMHIRLWCTLRMREIVKILGL